MKRSEVLMCDNFMSSALNLKTIIRKYVASIQKSLGKLPEKEDTDTETEMGGSNNAAVDEGMTESPLTSNINITTENPQKSVGSLALKGKQLKTKHFGSRKWRYRCEKCSTGYKYEKSFQAHIRYCRGPDRSKMLPKRTKAKYCDYCDKRFVYFNALSKHIKVCDQRIRSSKNSKSKSVAIPHTETSQSHPVEQAGCKTATISSHEASQLRSVDQVEYENTSAPAQERSLLRPIIQEDSVTSSTPSRNTEAENVISSIDPIPDEDVFEGATRSEYAESEGSKQNSSYEEHIEDGIQSSEITEHIEQDNGSAVREELSPTIEDVSFS